MLLKVFQLCFWVGVLFTAASFILGQLMDFSELDADIDNDVDSDTAAGGKGDSVISPFKPVVIAAFITVFGGMGIIGLQYLTWNVLITLAIAFFSAFIISLIMFKFLIVPLYKAQSTSTVSQQELIGLPAEVQLDIKDNRFGRITYVINNNTYSAPARSVDGYDIAKGTKVAIVDIKENVFMVTEI